MARSGIIAKLEKSLTKLEFLKPKLEKSLTKLENVTLRFGARSY